MIRGVMKKSVLLEVVTLRRLNRLPQTGMSPQGKLLHVQELLVWITPPITTVRRGDQHLCGRLLRNQVGCPARSGQSRAPYFPRARSENGPSEVICGTTVKRGRRPVVTRSGRPRACGAATRDSDGPRRTYAGMRSGA